MKKTFLFSMISLALMLCACQKDNDSNEDKPVTPDPPAELTIQLDSVSFTMLFVKSGSTHGHSTTTDYYIGQTEVTQQLWTAIMGSNPVILPDDVEPIRTVSYNDIAEFITKLNLTTGKTFRLPTEEEWFYAAYGGRKSKGYKYSGSDIIDSVAWYRENTPGGTQAVGTKQPNELNIYDMTGNVSEMCTYFDTTQVLLLGGSYMDNADNCLLSAATIIANRTFTGVDHGFRLVLIP